jgi:hypothetical protein
VIQFKLQGLSLYYRKVTRFNILSQFYKCGLFFCDFRFDPNLLFLPWKVKIGALLPLLGLDSVVSSQIYIFYFIFNFGWWVFNKNLTQDSKNPFIYSFYKYTLGKWNYDTIFQVTYSSSWYNRTMKKQKNPYSHRA